MEPDWRIIVPVLTFLAGMGVIAFIWRLWYDTCFTPRDCGYFEQEPNYYKVHRTDYKRFKDALTRPTRQDVRQLKWKHEAEIGTYKLRLKNIHTKHNKLLVHLRNLPENYNED